MAADSKPTLSFELMWWDKQPEDDVMWEMYFHSPRIVDTLDEALAFLVEHKGRSKLEVIESWPGEAASVLTVRSSGEGLVVEAQSSSLRLYLKSDGSTEGF